MIAMKYDSVSLATAFARSVFPHPGGPYSSTPFGGSIPSLLKSSGCFRGSSTISLTFSIASLSPPTSSYVTRGTLAASAGFSRIVSVVSSFTMTIPEGLVETTANGIACPSTGIRTLSPSTTGVSASLLFTKLTNPESTLIVNERGASFTRLAGLDSAFLTVIFSPIPTPAFLRISPSILMMSMP